MKLKKGISVVEAVLIMIILLSLTQLAFNGVKNSKGGQGLDVLRPDRYLQGMVRSGVWKNADTNTDLDLHRNRYYRSVTTKGEDLKN